MLDSNLALDNIDGEISDHLQYAGYFYLRAFSVQY